MAEKRTLVLNLDYTPYSVTSWKRAFCQIIINKEIPDQGMSLVDVYKNCKVRSGGGDLYDVPAVVKLSEYIDRSKKRVPFSRKNVLIRDKCQCQYCGKKFPPEDLTYDHVIPRAIWKKQKLKGTPTNWENIVAACRICNTFKGDAPLEKSGVRLLKQPVSPSYSLYVPGFWPYSKSVPEEWKPYLRIVYKDLF